MDNTKKRMKWVFAWLLKWCLLTGLFVTAGAGCVSAGEMEAPSVRDLLQDRTRGFSVRASYCEGADGYEISWSLDPGFSGETTSRLEDGKRTVHVRGFQDGDTVYVRFRAVRNEGKKEEYSEWGKARSVKITGRIIKRMRKEPYACAIYGIDDNGICVYWKKPEGADGYQIWRSYHSHYGFEPVKEIEGHNIFTWYDSGFDHDVSTVYYRVCAYEIRKDGRKVYTRFGNLLTAGRREALKLERNEIYMYSGEERTIQAYYGWGNAHDLEWESSDPKVVSVDEGGVIRTLKKGTSLITGTVAGTDQSASIKVTVDRDDPPLAGEISLRYRKGEDGIWYNPDAEKTDEALIMMGGDLTCLAPQMDMCVTPDGNYDFRGSFGYVKPVLEKSDLAVGNLETMIASEFSYANEEPYIDGKPVANCPSSYLEAVIAGGFDAVGTGNNHNCDTGTKGVISTLETLDRFGIPHTGTFASSDEDRYLIFDVNGIKVGLAAFNYKFPGYNGKDADWTEEEKKTMLSYYGPKRAKRTIRKMRRAGAEFVIIYIHWGTKNYFTVRGSQKRVARQLAKAGADYIAGAHSHTVQPYTEVKGRKGKMVPCIYSMGDFNTHIDQIEGNRDAVLMCVKLKRNEDGEVVIDRQGYIPFYTCTRYENNYYVTLPMDPDWNGGLKLSQADEINARISSLAGDGLEWFKPEEEQTGA